MSASDLRRVPDADLRFQLALIAGELAQRSGGRAAADILARIKARVEQLSAAERLQAMAANDG